MSAAQPNEIMLAVASVTEYSMTMDTKTKELIALASSVAANCQPCLKYHFKIALDSGASENEIKNAIEIARYVKSKSAAIMDEFAKKIFSDSVESSEESCQEKSSESGKVCCG